MLRLATAGTTTHAGCVTKHATETLNGGDQVREISARTLMKGIKLFDDVF
jgi:hypothetical protein